MFDVVTAPVVRRLTTVEAAREELGSLADSYSDTRLGRVIDRVSSAILSVAAIYPWQTVRERLRVEDSGTVLLSVYPARSVTTVEEYGWAYQWASEHFTLDTAAGALHLTPYMYRPETARQRRLVVTYTGGWMMPGQDGRDLPEDIEAVALDLVRNRVADLARDPSIRSESSPDAGVITYFGTNQPGSSALADLIARYAPVRM